MYIKEKNFSLSLFSFSFQDVSLILFHIFIISFEMKSLVLLTSFSFSSYKVFVSPFSICPFYGLLQELIHRFLFHMQRKQKGGGFLRWSQRGRERERNRHTTTLLLKDGGVASSSYSLCGVGGVSGDSFPGTP